MIIFINAMLLLLEIVYSIIGLLAKDKDFKLIMYHLVGECAIAVCIVNAFR